MDLFIYTALWISINIHLIKLTHYDETMKMAYDSQTAKDMHQAPTNILKLYVRAVIESEVWPTVVQLKR